MAGVACATNLEATVQSHRAAQYRKYEDTRLSDDPVKERRSPVPTEATWVPLSAPTPGPFGYVLLRTIMLINVR
jgi:hypothetical protein